MSTAAAVGPPRLSAQLCEAAAEDRSGYPAEEGGVVRVQEVIARAPDDDELLAERALKWLEDHKA